uniref:CCHC-type domain-containing protein n=1 Tax=Strigamia maritima TaxID=126957 RepID=T1IHL7_STRMM
MSANRCPEPLVVMEKMRFNQRVQAPTESISEFVSALRALSKHCGFGADLNNREGSLTLETAVQTALSMELPSAEVEKLHKPLTTQVNYTPQHVTKQAHKNSVYCSNSKQKQRPNTRNKPKRSSGNCSACGKTNHTIDACRFKNATCHGCGRAGHIKPVCPTTNTNSQNGTHSFDVRKQVPFYHVKCTNKVHMTSLRPNLVNPIVLKLQVANVMLPMEVDTGAAATIISSSCFQLNFALSFKLQKLSTEMTTYSGQLIKMSGIFEVPVAHKGQQFTLPLCVAKNSPVSLLGRNWLHKFGYIESTCEMMGATINSLEMASVSAPHPATDAKLTSLLEKHAHVFRDEIGCSKSMQVHIDIDKTANPIFLKAYPVLMAMKEVVEKEIRRLQSLGIISPIPASRWTTLIMHVVKSDS